MTLRCLLAILAFAIVPASAQDAERGYRLQVDKTGWGNGSPADIRKVLLSSCDAIHSHFGEAKLPEAIRVRRDKSGPIVLFKRGVRGEIIVQLDTGDRFWSQYAYQMAHEFCHILCGFREGKKTNLWFEETLCELASIFALRAMAESWKTDPPYRNWKDYAKSLDRYISDVEKKYQLPDGLTAAGYYRLHAEALTKKPTDRAKNGIIATALLPHFERQPEHWPAVRYLNKGRAKDDTSFQKYLENWHREAPEKHRIFIKDIARELGIRL